MKQTYGNGYKHLSHGFGPLYNHDSDTLILGSFPSAKSREQQFYYGHPQNRFWKIIAALYGADAPAPDDIESKKRLILTNHLALWDVIEECDIIGSSDASIRNAVVTDIPALMNKTRIKRVFVNGATAYHLYAKYQEPVTGIKAVQLPSSSPANAAWSLERLISAWEVIISQTL